MDSILITIGLQATFYSIGCCHLMNTMVLKVHGGNVLAAIKYFILQRCVVNHVVIHSQVTAGRVHHDSRIMRRTI